MVFQNYALYPHMTVYDNMAFSLKLAHVEGAELRRRVDDAAQILGLMDYLQRYPRQLSGGQRQRVAMGRAIVRKPQVFLFDEPLSNLDAKLRVAMRTEIKALHQRLKTTSVYVTHDQIEAMTMADKIVVMNAGKVEQIGTPLELYDHPANLFVAGFIGSPAMNFIPEKRNGKDVLVGIRPEHLAIASDGLAAEVVVVEPTGADTQIFCKVNGVDITAVVRERHEFRPGEAVHLKPQLTYLFDPASGARLA
jgi:multiple sugar transport system ATP-binding protein